MSNISDNSNQKDSKQDNKKDLEFWNFTEEGLNFSARSAFQSSFPDGKLASYEEMNKIHQTLKNRMQILKNSSCYNYLECYYDFYLKTYNSKNEDQMEKNFDYSMKCLKLYTFCSEFEKEEGNQMPKIEI
jgi:hypothetical protein